MNTPALFGPLLRLPRSADAVLGAYWRPDTLFIQELAAYLRGARVLEAFAGNGYLAAWLARADVHVQATSRKSGHDAHEAGFFHPVEQSMRAFPLLGELAAKRHQGVSRLARKGLAQAVGFYRFCAKRAI